MSYSIKDYTKYQELRKIIEHFWEKDLKLNMRKLEFLDPLTCKNLTAKKNCLDWQTRVIRIGEPFRFKMKLQNNYKLPIDDLVLNNFRFQVSFKEGDADKVRLTAADLVSQPKKMAEIFEFSVKEMSRSSSDLILEINMIAKKKGVLRFEVFEWDEFEVTRRHVLYNDTSRFTTYKIHGACGKIDISVQGITDSVLTGQIQRGSITISNTIDQPIDKILLFSSDPSLSGFARKTINNMAGNSKQKIDFN